MARRKYRVGQLVRDTMPGACLHQIGRIIEISAERDDHQPYLVEWNPDGSKITSWCPEVELVPVNGLMLFKRLLMKLNKN